MEAMWKASFTPDGEHVVSLFRNKERLFRMLKKVQAKLSKQEEEAIRAELDAAAVDQTKDALTNSSSPSGSASPSSNSSGSGPASSGSPLTPELLDMGSPLDMGSALDIPDYTLRFSPDADSIKRPRWTEEDEPDTFMGREMAAKMPRTQVPLSA